MITCQNCGKPHNGLPGSCNTCGGNVDSTRPSAWPTIEDATNAAMISSRANRKAIAVIADQPHDGGFALADEACVDTGAAYIMVDRNGEPREGPAALSLPIDFSGALPVK